MVRRQDEGTGLGGGEGHGMVLLNLSAFENEMKAPVLSSAFCIVLISNLYEFCSSGVKF